MNPSLDKARREAHHFSSKIFHINYSKEDLGKSASVVNIYLIWGFAERFS